MKNFKQFILFCLLLAATNCFAATGELLSAVICTNSWTPKGGWALELKFKGLSTGGTYDTGLTSTNTVDAANIRLTLVSEGFDNRGNAIRRARTIYGTKPIRKPYPNDANYADATSGSDVLTYFALSDWVYAEDSNILLYLGAGVYTQGGNPTLATNAVTVTNKSIIPVAHAKVVGNFVTPQYQIVTNKTHLDLHYKAGAQHGIAAIQFFATDGTLTNTAWIPAGPLDTLHWPQEVATSSFGDPVPVQEFYKPLMCRNLTNSHTIDTWAVIYPMIGDADSVLNTGDGVNVEPTALYTKQRFLLDQTGTYGYTSARVNASTGNDGTGTASPTPTVSGNDFATINGALAAIAATNNSVYGRNDVSGGIVYLTDDAAHASFGGSSSYGTNNPFWVLIRNEPGDSPVISSTSGNTSLGNSEDKLWLQGIEFSGTSTLYTGNEHLWVDDCYVHTTGTFSFDENKITYWTRNLIEGSVNNYGIGPTQATKDSSPALVRGNTFSNYTGSVLLYRAMGNITVGTKSSGPKFATFRDAAQVVTNSDNVIFAENYLRGMTCSAIVLNMFDDGEDVTHGALIENSLLEGTGDSTSPLFWITADSSTNETRNIIVRNLELHGQRASLFYNDNGSLKKDMYLHRMEGCLMVVTGCKTDTFATENANRTGNWGMLYGCGFKDNLFPHLNIGLAGAQFPFEFPGINSWQASTVQATNYLAVVRNWAYLNNGATAGFGNYRKTTSSPHHNLHDGTVSRMDIEGHDASGSYGYFGAHSYHPESSTIFVSKLADTSESGTYALPYNTAQEGITDAAAGETVKLGGGYWAEQTTTSTSGSSGNRITVDGQGSATLQRFSSANSYYTLQNMRLSGFQNNAQGHIRPLIGCNFLIVTNCVVDMAEAPGVRGIDIQNHSVDPWGNAPSNWLITDTEFLRELNQRVVITYGFNGVLSNCWFHDAIQGDFLTVFGSNIVVVANVFSNNVPSLSDNYGNHIDCIQTFGNNNDGAADIYIRNNYFADSEHGYQLEPDGVNEIVRWNIENNIHNRVHGIGSILVPHTRFRNNLWFECNTNSASGSHVIQFGVDADGGNADHGVVENNMFIKCGDGSLGKGWYGLSANLLSVATSFTNRYNYVAIGGSYTAPTAGTVGPLDPAFDNFEFYEPGTGITGGNPQFFDEAGDDFRLKNNSPAIDAGMSQTNWFTDDITGWTREGWDIGPYFAASGPDIWIRFDDAGGFSDGGQIDDWSGNNAHALRFGFSGSVEWFPTQTTEGGWKVGEFSPDYFGNEFQSASYWPGDYAAITNVPASLKGASTELTVAFWARSDDTPGGDYTTYKSASSAVVNAGWNTKGAFHFGRHESSTSGNFKFLVTTNTTSLGDSVKAVFPLPDGYTGDTMTHYAATVALTDSGQTVTIIGYTNGIAAITNVASLQPADAVTSINIGDPAGAFPPWIGLSCWTHNQTAQMEIGSQPNTGWWDGTMRDLRIYDTALTASQIGLMAGELVAGGGDPPGPGPGPGAGTWSIGTLIIGP